MSLTIGNSIAARRSTRRHAQVKTKNRRSAKIRSTFLVLSCSALLATGIIVVMQQLDTPVAIENEPSAKGHVMMESKADRRGQQISDDGDLRKQRLETEAALLEASASIGLTNLSDASDIQDEIRVCGGLCGSIYPQCLQITRTHNVNQATFFAPNDMGKMDSKGGLIYERIILVPAKSGWGKLFSFLEGQ